MTLAEYPELTRLSKRQRLKLAEALWFSSIDDSAPVSAKDKRLLDARWTSYQSGKSKRITLAELTRRAAKS